MGLFSSEKKTYVGTTVSRVLKDEDILSSLKTGTIKAIYEGGDEADYIMEDLVAGVATKAHNYYNYGKRSYVYGLPSGSVATRSLGADEVEAIVETTEGQQVLLSYCYLSPLNYTHFAYKKLVTAYGYDDASQELKTLTIANGGKVHTLSRVSLCLTQSMVDALPSEALMDYGNGCALIVDNTLTEPKIEIRYFWSEAVIVNGEATSQLVVGTALFALGMDLVTYVDKAEYFHASYVVDGLTKYWEYLANSGTYPSMDNLLNTSETAVGSYFPFGYFRYGKVSMAEDQTTDAFKSSKRLFNKIGIKYLPLVESIHENPDIDGVEQAMFVMAVPAETTNKLEQQYLYEYFASQFLALNGQITELSQTAFNSSYTSDLLVDSSTVIQDTKFKMVLSNQGVWKRLVVGTIGAINSFSSGTVDVTYIQEYIERTSENGDVVTQRTVVTPSHYYRKQVSSTEYEELQVLGLSMQYNIIEGYFTTGDGDTNTSILLIPLDMSVTKQLSLVDKEELYSRAMHFVFNSVQIITIKWYQSSFFQFLLVVAALVIGFYNLEAGLYIAALTAGTMTLIQVAVAISLKLLVMYATGELIKLFVKAVGIEAAIIIALIAAASGVYISVTEANKAALAFAKNLIGAATSLVSAAQKVKMEDLLGEANNFKLFVEEQTKLLDKAADLLDDGPTLLSPYTVLGESPDNFYNRTVHAGNVGILGLQAISTYVERSLALPTFNDTQERFKYV